MQTSPSLRTCYLILMETGSGTRTILGVSVPVPFYSGIGPDPTCLHPYIERVQDLGLIFTPQIYKMDVWVMSYDAWILHIGNIAYRIISIVPLLRKNLCPCHIHGMFLPYWCIKKLNKKKLSMNGQNHAQWSMVQSQVHGWPSRPSYSTAGSPSSQLSNFSCPSISLLGLLSIFFYWSQYSTNVLF